MECFFDIRRTDWRHFFLITFVIVFQLVTQSKSMVVDTAIVQPLLARERIKEHFNRHEIADFHRLVKPAVGECWIVIPIAINAVVESKRDSDVSPVHIKRVEFQTVFAHVKTEFHAGVFREVVHKRSLQVRKFIIQTQVQKSNRIAQVEHVTDIGRTPRKHPTRWPLMAFGMELSRKRTDFYARLAEPFLHGILTARTTIHLEHGT